MFVISRHIRGPWFVVQTRGDGIHADPIGYESLHESLSPIQRVTVLGNKYNGRFPGFIARHGVLEVIFNP